MSFVPFHASYFTVLLSLGQFLLTVGTHFLGLPYRILNIQPFSCDLVIFFPIIFLHHSCAWDMKKTSFNTKKYMSWRGNSGFQIFQICITSGGEEKKTAKAGKYCFILTSIVNEEVKNQSPCVWGRVSELPVILPATDTKESMSIKAEAASLVSALA